jgi:hypothetical protein
VWPQGRPGLAFDGGGKVLLRAAKLVELRQRLLLVVYRPLVAVIPIRQRSKDQVDQAKDEEDDPGEHPQRSGN